MQISPDPVLTASNRSRLSRVLVGSVIGLLSWAFFAAIVLVVAVVGWAVVGWAWFLAGLRLIAVLFIACIAWGIIYALRRPREGN